MTSKSNVTICITTRFLFIFFFLKKKEGKKENTHQAAKQSKTSYQTFFKFLFLIIIHHLQLLKWFLPFQEVKNCEKVRRQK